MLVATHKPADVPVDGFYLPVHVGHALNPVDLGYQPDDAGDNISARNGSYCELTAVYWAWKNLDAEVVGLSHYRRYFRGSQPGPNGKGILSASQADALLHSADIVLSKPRNYYIETIESHYHNAHHGSDLEALKRAVGDVSPQFLPAFNRVFQGRKLSLYNMFLMRRDLFDEYATWLFAILEATEMAIGEDVNRTAYQGRTYGYLGERLLNVFTTARPQLRVTHAPVVNTDGEPKVSKAINLVRRKAGLISPAARTN